MIEITETALDAAERVISKRPWPNRRTLKLAIEAAMVAAAPQPPAANAPGTPDSSPDSPAAVLAETMANLHAHGVIDDATAALFVKPDVAEQMAEALRIALTWSDKDWVGYEAVKGALEAFNASKAVAPTEQRTKCAKCGQEKHTPLRIDWMGGYICLTCADEALEAAAPATEWHVSISELAGRVLSDLGFSTCPSMDPGADLRRDRIAALIAESVPEPSLLPGDIIIRTNAEHGVEVWQDGLTTGEINIGEMLEQVLSLVLPRRPLPKNKNGCYAMRTPEEWAALRKAAYEGKEEGDHADT